jgi:hypothetical protein
MEDNERTISRLRGERERTANELEAGIDFLKRTGADSQNRIQDQLRRQQIEQSSEHENAMIEMRRDANAKLNDAHMQGKRKLGEATEQYETQVNQTRKEARERVRETQLKNDVALTQINAEAHVQEALARRGYEDQKRVLESQRQETLEKYSQENSKLEAKLTQAYKEQSRLISDQKREALDQTRAQAREEFAYTEAAGKQMVQESIARNAARVAAHEEREKDPFYRLTAIGTQVTDGETETVVHVTVPEHEQESVRLTAQNNGQLTVSGSRRSETTHKGEDGHTQASHSYQSYSESFPVAGKLEMNRMQRGYAEGRVTFRIPKG